MLDTTNYWVYEGIIFYFFRFCETVWLFCYWLLVCLFFVLDLNLIIYQHFIVLSQLRCYTFTVNVFFILM